MKSRIKAMVAAVAIAAAALLAAPPPEAKASVYNLVFDGPSVDFNAQVVTNASDLVTSISGFVTGPGGAAISGLDTTQVNGAVWNFDQLFTASDPHVTNNGILFDAGGFVYNLYSIGSGPFAYLNSSNNPGGSYNPGDNGTLTVTAVPEPATWAMLILGFLAIGLLSMRRRRTTPRAPFRFA